jgi:hypothetical protein
MDEGAKFDFLCQLLYPFLTKIGHKKIKRVKTEHLVLAIYQDYKYILIPLNIKKTQNISGYKKVHQSKQRWHSGNFSLLYNHENGNWTMQDEIGTPSN